MNSPVADQSPFAKNQPSRFTLSLGMLMLSMITFAALSFIIMLAARVPIIANSVNDFLGLPQNAKSEKLDRATHLIFLLFCYSSPLLFATWVGIMHSMFNAIAIRWNDSDTEDQSNPLN